VTADAGAAAVLAAFTAGALVPEAARRVAQVAWLDTIGVIVAGAVEPPARMVQRVCAADGRDGSCRVLGTSIATTPGNAALANGTAAHALDYDDMCFVSMAHPSAPLVAASLAAGELAGSSGRELLDAYVVGFEIECVLGRAMNPSHYARGWHCTSTLGSIGAAAAVSRLLRLDAARTAHALSIAASEASGLKENFGSMVKPLHAGMAARNGVLAAMLAREGFTASITAIEGSQGFVAAFSDGNRDLSAMLAALHSRWEIVETGIAVKLYPSCAATHPTIDAIVALRRSHRFTADQVDAIDVTVDSVTPGVLIYPAPENGLEAKFSMPFCAAAAAAEGAVTVETFDEAHIADPTIRRLSGRVTMHVDEDLGRYAPSLTQARVAVRLSDGRILTAGADGARGYPSRPASREELDAKFRACAARLLPDTAIDAAVAFLHRLDMVPDVRSLTAGLAAQAHHG
jgi:2-methylcitrate dehydratase PrpD